MCKDYENTAQTEDAYARDMYAKQAAMARQPKVYALHVMADGGFAVMLGYTEVTFATNNLHDALDYISKQVTKYAARVKG